MVDRPLRPTRDNRLGRLLTLPTTIIPRNLIQQRKILFTNTNELKLKKFQPKIKKYLVLIEIHLKQLKDCHALLTSTPRIMPTNNTFKLACVKHIASIHSEPGSRSYLYVLKSKI